MKLESKNSEFRTNAKNQHGFTIAANAKMFEVLYSKIYTYKIDAIVRELAANAYDSHVEAGKKDVPFNVVLPNPMYEYFEIEDFGVGMDNDEVMNIYTGYGVSTKTETNDLIGGLGLGSKTPFSYTDMFTIRARKNLVERTYTAYIGADGRPMVSPLNEKPTDQCNGVQIKIPVKFGDREQFRSACEFVLSLYDPAPKVTGTGFMFNIKNDEVSKLKDYGILFSKTQKEISSSLYGNGGGSNNLFVLMGSVAYPIKLYSLYGKLRSDIYSMLSSKYSNAIFVRFPIGSLEVSASREALSFDADGKTLATLCEGIERSVLDSLSSVQEKMNNASNFIEACKVVFDEFGYYNADLFSNYFSNLITFKNQKFGKYFSTVRQQYDDRFFYQKFSAESAGNYKFASYRTVMDMRTRVNKVYYKMRFTSTAAEFIFNSFDPSVDVVVLYDTTPKLVKRMVALTNVLTGREAKATVVYTLKKQCKQKDIDALKKIFPTVEFMKVSDNNESAESTIRIRRKPGPAKLDVYVLNAIGVRRIPVEESQFNSLYNPKETEIFCYDSTHEVEECLGIKLRSGSSYTEFAQQKMFANLVKLFANPNICSIVFIKKQKTHQKFIDTNQIRNVNDIPLSLIGGDKLIDLMIAARYSNVLRYDNKHIKIYPSMSGAEHILRIIGDIDVMGKNTDEQKSVDNVLKTAEKYINERYPQMDDSTINTNMYNIVQFNNALIFKLIPNLYDTYRNRCNEQCSFGNVMLKWDAKIAELIRTKAPLLIPLLNSGLCRLDDDDLEMYVKSAKGYFKEMTTETNEYEDELEEDLQQSEEVLVAA